MKGEALPLNYDTSKEARMVMCRNLVGLIHGKVLKTMRYRKWRWNPNLYATSWKNDFLLKDLKNAPNLQNISQYPK
jgi:hypothetical protein